MATAPASLDLAADYRGEPLRRAKFAAAAAFGFSANDVYLLRGIRNRTLLPRLFVGKLPPISFTPPTPVDEYSLKLCERIIAAFRLSGDSKPPCATVSELWARNLGTNQGALRQALCCGSARTLAILLGGMFQSGVVVGFHPGKLANQGNWRVHALRTLDTIKSAGDRLTPAQMGVPNVGASYGVVYRGHLIAPGAVEHSHAVSQITTLRPSSVLEIGGGYGGAALKAVQAGTPQYTVIDLPEINAIQAFFLGMALGAERVGLFGETERSISILPPWALQKHRPVDLAFSQDSLPEVPRLVGEQYADWIARNAQQFYSYNHEMIDRTGHYAVATAPEIMTGRMTRVSRSPSPLQRGYYEEIWHQR